MNIFLKIMAMALVTASCFAEDSFIVFKIKQIPEVSQLPLKYNDYERLVVLIKIDNTKNYSPGYLQDTLNKEFKANKAPLAMNYTYKGDYEGEFYIVTPISNVAVIVPHNIRHIRSHDLFFTILPSWVDVVPNGRKLIRGMAADEWEDSWWDCNMFGYN